MGRQILTFVIVLVGLMLLMKTCAGKPGQGGGIVVEKPAPDADATVLTHAGSGAEVRLAPDGSVASIQEGAPVVRAVAADRRPFHLFLGQTDTAARIPDAAWTKEEIPGGGWKYVYAKDKLRIEKSVRFAEDGHALILDLKAEGIPDEAIGFVLTGASGVELTGEEGESPFAFTELLGGKPKIHSFAGLRQAREEAAGRLYATKEELTSTDRVKRFGLFGRAFSLALEDLPAVSKLYVDVYRAEREEGQTDEAETWVDLVAPKGAFEGTFTLRWTPREKAVVSFPAAPVRPGKDYVLEDDTFQVVFTDRGGAIREMWLKKYSTVAGEAPSAKTWIPILGSGTAEGDRALTLFADGHDVDPAHEIWEALPSEDGRSILFTLSMPDGWTFRKRVTLPEAGHFDMGVEIEVSAPKGATASQAVVSLIGPSGSYIVDSYRGIIGAEAPAVFILDRNEDRDSKKIDDLKKGILDRGYAEERRGLFRAIGTRGTYFVCLLVSEDPKNAVTSAIGKGIRLDKPQEREDGKPPTTDSMLGRVGLALPLEDGHAAQAFRLYAGPNETGALKELEITGSVNFGFFGPIGRVLMWLMKGLHSIVGSYGISIMLMTVIVRACLLPVSFKTQLSMQRYSKRIQKIKPLLDEVQKKYAKDAQRMNQERMKVMREHGVGLPLGCLMIFFQIPIWYALFQALRVEFALRHQPFLWVSDLSMPDRILHLPFWPTWFNLLPILMLVLWVLQQKFAPTPGASDDPQVKMQMKMMRFMPFVFFMFLYNYAAALALYMCVSSSWTIAESKLVRRAVAKLG